MKLYLGCAEPPFHPQHLAVLGNPDDWTWVDYYIDHPKVKKWDASRLDEVEDGTIEKIYNSHLLEHLPQIHILQILQTWHRKLVAGGELIINVPDLLWACRQLTRLENGGILDGYFFDYDGEHGLMSIFYGAQSHEGEYHKAGFTKKLLNRLLVNAGFSDVDIIQTVDAHDMGVLIATCKK